MTSEDRWRVIPGLLTLAVIAAWYWPIYGDPRVRTLVSNVTISGDEAGKIDPICRAATTLDFSSVQSFSRWPWTVIVRNPGLGRASKMGAAPGQQIEVRFEPLPLIFGQILEVTLASGSTNCSVYRSNLSI